MNDNITDTMINSLQNSVDSQSKLSKFFLHFHIAYFQNYMYFTLISTNNCHNYTSQYKLFFCILPCAAVFYHKFIFSMQSLAATLYHISASLIIGITHILRSNICSMKEHYIRHMPRFHQHFSLPNSTCTDLFYTHLESNSCTMAMEDE